MNPTSGPRDILVILREEVAHARATLVTAGDVHASEPDAKVITTAAARLRAACDALEARIKGPFDAVLLDRAAASFRAAAKALGELLSARRAARQASKDVHRVLKRVVAHAREIGKITHQVGADHVGDAIDSLADVNAWQGPALDGLTGLVDTLMSLSRKRLGDAAEEDQLSSLVDRAASTATVTSLHALKDLARRAASEPTLMRDRFQLDQALKAASASVVERLAGWLKLDAAGRAQLAAAVEGFTRGMLDRATRS